MDAERQDSRQQSGRDCECPAAGWCERHGFRKTTIAWDLCRTRQDLRDQWDRGENVSVEVEAEPAPRGPGMGRRVLNFGRALVRHALDGARTVSDKVFEDRLEICRDCASCDLEKMVCREKACGCQIASKARWRSETCPLGKWSPIED